ncbi:MAG: hypothetical protein K0S38_486 [Candidatus Paceibacter sp.]|jgi:heme/copper-type cytochrome/quinol oxidase subunit 2|nr:hypothetical protein [Candidatus Paceibacter sp.]
MNGVFVTVICLIGFAAFVAGGFYIPGGAVIKFFYFLSGAIAILFAFAIGAIYWILVRFEKIKDKAADKSKKTTVAVTAVPATGVAVATAPTPAATATIVAKAAETTEKKETKDKAAKKDWFWMYSFVAAVVFAVLVGIACLIALELVRPYLLTPGFYAVLLAVVAGALLLRGKFVKTYAFVILLSVFAAIVFAEPMSLAHAGRKITELREKWMGVTDYGYGYSNSTKPSSDPLAGLPLTYGWEMFTAPCEGNTSNNKKFYIEGPRKKNPDGTDSEELDPAFTKYKDQYNHITFPVHEPDRHLIVWVSYLADGGPPVIQNYLAASGVRAAVRYYEFYTRKREPVPMYGGYFRKDLTYEQLMSKTNPPPEFAEFKRQHGIK